MDAQEATQILDEERTRGRALVAEARDADALRAAEVAALGRKSRYADVQRSLATLPPEDRRTVGKLANEVRSLLEAELEHRREELSRADEERLLAADALDVTLPGRRPR